MSTLTQIAILVLSVAVVWGPGYLLASLVLARSQTAATLVAAHGLMLGYLLMSLIVRAMHALEVPLQFWPITVALTALTAVIWLFLRAIPVTPEQTYTATSFTKDLSPIHKAAIAVLLSLIALRLAQIAIEAMLRPIFAWDAWDAWVPRTLQFFTNHSLDAPVVTIKGTHGIFANIVHLWQMLALGTAENTLAGLPWVMAIIALLCGVHGATLKQRQSPSGAMLAAWLLISLPFLSIHSMLVGYADLWVALSFFLGISCCHLLLQRVTPEAVTLVIIYAVTCMSIKQAGLGIGLILLIALVWTLLKGRPLLKLSFVACALVFAWVLIGMMRADTLQEVAIPGLGTLNLGKDIMTLSGWFSFKLGEYTAIGAPIRESILWFANWHLLYFGLIFVALWSTLLGRNTVAFQSPIPLAIVLGLVYTWVYHGYRAPDAAFGHQGLSRSMLYFAAPGILWLTFCFSAPSAGEGRIGAKDISNGRDTPHPHT